MGMMKSQKGGNGNGKNRRWRGNGCLGPRRGVPELSMAERLAPGSSLITVTGRAHRCVSVSHKWNAWPGTIEPGLTGGSLEMGRRAGTWNENAVSARAPKPNVKGSRCKDSGRLIKWTGDDDGKGDEGGDHLDVWLHVNKDPEQHEEHSNSSMDRAPNPHVCSP